MRKVLTVLLLSTLAIGTASAETLHFGTTTANPPFVTANGKNQPVGFDIDLAPALCQQMQAQCQFTAQRFDTLIPALRFKKFDAVIAGMEVIPMREKQVAFSRPYRQALCGVVIVNKDVAHTFADLKAKKVGVVKGTLHQRYLRDKQKAVHAFPYDDLASALASLKAGPIKTKGRKTSPMSSTPPSPVSNSCSSSRMTALPGSTPATTTSTKRPPACSRRI